MQLTSIPNCTVPTQNTQICPSLQRLADRTSSCGRRTVVAASTLRRVYPERPDGVRSQDWHEPTTVKKWWVLPPPTPVHALDRQRLQSGRFLKHRPIHERRCGVGPRSRLARFKREVPLLGYTRPLPRPVGNKMPQGRPVRQIHAAFLRAWVRTACLISSTLFIAAARMPCGLSGSFHQPEHELGRTVHLSARLTSSPRNRLRCSKASFKRCEKVTARKQRNAPCCARALPAMPCAGSCPRWSWAGRT